MKYSFLIMGVLITLFACKKPQTTTPPTTQLNTVTALSYTVDAQGNPSGTYNAFFYMDSSYSSSTSPNVYSSLTTIGCLFLTTPQSYQNINGNTNTAVNSVKVNADELTYSSLYYQDLTGNVVSAPYNWRVIGAGAIPSFTYTSTTPKPAYPGFFQLPNVISQQQNFTLPLNTASGYDMFSVSIVDNANTSKGIRYSVSNTASSVIIPKDSLARFTSGSGVQISTTLTKFNPQSAGGKNFIFSTALNYQKIVTIQ